VTVTASLSIDRRPRGRELPGSFRVPVRPPRFTYTNKAVNILTLKPVDPDDPPDGFVPHGSVRGIVIYWRPASPKPVNRRGPQSFQLPLPLWQAQHVDFHEVSPSGADEPPRDAAEQARFVRLAYALVACSHPIPSDAEICYQVWW
jgi:hypothetical protein